ncbi:DUF4037 domain-containing protein [Promicromonospora iranensis]|uniref:DUF4037 domain-containing protein n=1 Tax=Promicromonospora iranensis TaxID=1105144 RepID=A0ABU2CI25_9MICO|nr:DUF4037 domain-containing protein [Promicromonospora iranensis]MDR7380982.1 hypothetical protein [Promicromonospora iranensis]
MSGIELARAYWADVVRPILDRKVPDVPRAAGRLGTGSDVLGLDDATSRDHDWGLRLTVLVPADRVAEVDEVLTTSLPSAYRGRPTAFPLTWDPTVRHRVEVATPAELVRSRTGLVTGLVIAPGTAPGTAALSVTDWLSLTGQSVLEITAGPVFEDTSGEITALRDLFAWYPHDVWLHVLAADWNRIEQELPFVGRTGQRGDDLGSRLLAARLSTALVRLGFLLERRWPPYPKWAGTLFERLPVAPSAGGHLADALAAPTWQARDAALRAACEALHDRQRAVGLPVLEGAACEPFFDRPFTGLRGVPEVLRAAITDPEVRALSHRGGVEQWVDDVGTLTDPGVRARLTTCS